MPRTWVTWSVGQCLRVSDVVGSATWSLTWLAGQRCRISDVAWGVNAARSLTWSRRLSSAFPYG